MQAVHAVSGCGGVGEGVGAMSGYRKWVQAVRAVSECGSG